jgi:hypothetical protein
MKCKYIKGKYILCLFVFEFMKGEYIKGKYILCLFVFEFMKGEYIKGKYILCLFLNLWKVNTSKVNIFFVCFWIYER